MQTDKLTGTAWQKGLVKSIRVFHALNLNQENNRCFRHYSNLYLKY